MFQLVLKDLRVQKREKTFFIVILLSCCMGFIFPHNPALASLQLLLGVYLLLVYANAFDYKYNAEIMLNSLPLGREQVVKAKYISALFFSLIIFIISLLVGVSVSLAGTSGATGLSGLIIIQFLFLSLFLLAIYLTIFFPIYFKFGYLKARWANFIALFVIFGLIGFTGRIDDASYVTTYKAMQQFMAILAGEGSFQACLVLFLISICLLYFSQKISISVYQRKEF